MEYPVYKEETYKGFTIKIMWDTNPESPANWDNLGVIYSNCRNFNPYNRKIDEILVEDEDGEKHVNSDYVFLPVYAYIHGGIALSTSRGGQFSDQWDSGLAGIIAVHKDDVIKEYGDLTIESIEKAYKCLEGEVEEWDNFCQGNVFGYEIDEEFGTFFDSCWGFYGDPDYCFSEAKAVVDLTVEARERAKAFREKLLTELFTSLWEM